MTKAQGGSAVVADADGMLLGIFTDGDFRRAAAAGDPGAVLRDSISRHMTPNPMSVREDLYAAELLKLFGSRKIDDLVVCDAQGRVVGMVDIQDLPRMKVL